MQRTEIRRQAIRINSHGIRHRKTSGIKKDVMADIVEIAEDSPLAAVTVHRFSKIETHSLVSI
jgi:hypothetical protein